MPSLGGWEIVIILAVLLLLFGAKKLPDMARSVGQSARVFKGEMKGLKEDEGPKNAEAPAEKPSSPSQELSPGTTLNEASPQAQQATPSTPGQHGRTDAT